MPFNNSRSRLQISENLSYLVVLDRQRLASLLGKVMMHVSSHGDKSIGLQDLPLLMKEAGFVQIETGRIAHGMLGFVRGRTRA